MGESFGNYELIRKLATGGMAEVFLARHQSLGGFERLLCIKRILPHLSQQTEFISMFQDEARIAANLVHPNIAQIYDIDYHEENLQKDIDIPPHKIGQEITKLRKEMKNMSKEMRFEEAARLRDKIKKLRKVELSLIGEIE